MSGAGTGLSIKMYYDFILVIAVVEIHFGLIIRFPGVFGSFAFRAAAAASTAATASASGASVRRFHGFCDSRFE